MVARVWLKESTVIEMAPVEAAWLAGFFDGEGSIFSYPKPRAKDGKSWGLSISNTNYQSLEYCKTITNAGNISTKIVRKNRIKPQWVWRVYAQRDIVNILKQILPYSIIKKKAIREFLDYWSDL